MTTIGGEARSAILQRETQLTRDRDTFDPTWADIREHLLPWHGRNLLGSNSREEDTDGRLKNHKIYDGTATRALSVTAAGMQAGINSPARPWFRLGYADKDLAEFKPVSMWLNDVRDILMSIYSSANIYNVLHHLYLELIAFGTAAATIRPDFDTVIRARPYTIGEYWIGVNDRARVDTFYRKFEMTAIQMVRQFGINCVSDAVASAFNNKNTEARFMVHHFTEPNDGRIKIPFGRGFDYRCVYHEDGFPGGCPLRVNGTELFPVIAPRWSTVGLMSYGFGPGDAVLADIKGLQKERVKQLVALDKLVDPPLVGPSSLRDEVVNSMPGGITYDESLTQNAGLRPLYQVNPDINGISMSIQDSRNAIRQGLFTDLFTLIANTVDHQRTATEIAALKEEKMMVLGPVLESVHNEIHSPLIDAAFHYAEAAGILPEPPEEVQGLEIEVEYISILAQAQKMVSTTGIEQISSFVGNLSAVYPEARFKINATEAVDEYADSIGVNPKIINSDEEVAQMQQAEQQQQQMAQAMQMSAATADQAKVLSDTDMGSNNALTAMLGGTGG
jgi:hypothetical protein